MSVNIGIIFKDCVIIFAESRVTFSDKKQMDDLQKVFPINSNIIVSFVGNVSLAAMVYEHLEVIKNTVDDYYIITKFDDILRSALNKKRKKYINEQVNFLIGAVVDSKDKKEYYLYKYTYINERTEIKQEKFSSPDCDFVSIGSGSKWFKEKNIKDFANAHRNVFEEIDGIKNYSIPPRTRSNIIKMFIESIIANSSDQTIGGDLLVLLIREDGLDYTTRVSLNKYSIESYNDGVFYKENIDEVKPHKSPKDYKN